jgi:hypothetical protein
MIKKLYIKQNKRLRAVLGAFIAPKDPLKKRPETVEDIGAGFKAWSQKLSMLMSSLSRRNFEGFSQGTQVLTSTFSLNDLMQIRLAAKDKLKRKALGRKYTVGKGTVTVKDARIAISEKLERQGKKGKGRGKSRSKAIQDSIKFTISSDSDLGFSDGDDEIEHPEIGHPEMEG